MAESQLTSDGLNGLCSQEQLQLLNAIDSLRSEGISDYISLPQIIVCGDQSSGKSSVLEAISGVAFPVQSNLCTRFPTELVLRKALVSGVNVSIVPHQSRKPEERESLGKFNERLENFDEMPDLIERAKIAMGIMTQGKAFSNDLLRVEISGPERPHLTIVDLPGLIHSETKQQSASEVELVQEVVQGYMTEPRSIILAVVSAKNDYANQVVLKLAKKADPKGNRTLGVITKPDTLLPGSGSEQGYIALANNEDVEFRLGWHVVKNLDSEAGKHTLDQRDEVEADFFSRGAWASLQSSHLGIQSLRVKLSILLPRQILNELPNFMAEINVKLTACEEKLAKLGPPRSTLVQQRSYLLDISLSVQTLVKDAVDGTYSDLFFGDAMKTLGFEKRIRAVIQTLNCDFAEQLSRHGKRLTIVAERTDPETPEEEEEEEEREVAGHETNNTDKFTVTRQEFIGNIAKLLERSRGRELQGTFNPMIVETLFREQALPWETIIQTHVQKAWESAEKFLKHVILHVTDEFTYDAILEVIVTPKLDAVLEALKKRAKTLLSPHEVGHPITYNHYFTETLQRIRQERQKTHISAALRSFFGVPELRPHSSTRSFDLAILAEKILKQSEPDMSLFAASEALDCLEAYYKVALKRCIDDIAVEVIEEGLMKKLTKILDPREIAGMPDCVVSQVAGETEESQSTRERLEMQRNILKKGVETCKGFVGSPFLSKTE
ncbi:hypothetical protein G7046_g5252 [Stylonectria norvegica]|nr:hypothetical protein G7046_g5252 [Stylonectria norvegica]